MLVLFVIQLATNGLDGPRFESRQGKENLFSPKTAQTGSGAYPTPY
jgi:hypothetical protein